MTAATAEEDVSCAACIDGETFSTKKGSKCRASVPIAHPPFYQRKYVAYGSFCSVCVWGPRVRAARENVLAATIKPR